MKGRGRMSLQGRLELPFSREMLCCLLKLPDLSLLPTHPWLCVGEEIPPPVLNSWGRTGDSLCQGTWPLDGRFHSRSPLSMGTSSPACREKLGCHGLCVGRGSSPAELRSAGCSQAKENRNTSPIPSGFPSPNKLHIGSFSALAVDQGSVRDEC